MAILSRLSSLARNLFRKERVERELDEEVRAYVELLTAEKIKSGMSEKEARRQAMIEAGGVEQVKEQVREARLGTFFETLLQDLRYGLRQLRRSPGFTAVSVLTLAVGIAANSAIFSVYNAVALRPIQAREPGRLVNIFRTTAEDRFGWNFSYPEYVYFREHNTGFSNLIAASGTTATISGSLKALKSSAMGGGISSLAGIRLFQQMAGSAEMAPVAMVSTNYFRALGVGTISGRPFSPEEASGPSSVVMLSYNYWHRRFNSGPDVIGKTLKLNGKVFTIIGITPKDFRGTYPNVPSAWLPISDFPLVEPGRDVFHNRDDDSCVLVGRLRSGVSRDKVQAEMTVLVDQLRRTYPSGSKKGQPVSITLAPGSPLHLRPSAEMWGIIAMVMGAVGLVLLIACANVAGLELARSAARQKEIGVRLALGASRGRLIRQLLTEATLLGVLAGCAGLLLSWWAVRFLVREISDSLPPVWGTLALQVNPDLHVFAYTLGASLFAAMLFGLAPALEASKPTLVSVMKDEGTAFRGRLSRFHMRDLLVAIQVAISIVLLIAAGLLVRGSAQALKVDPGFETKRVLAMGIEIPSGLGYDAAKNQGIVQQLMARFSAVPGVKSVSLGRPPLAGGLRSATVSTNGFVNQSRDAFGNLGPHDLYYSYVSPNYFETLGIPIVRGRSFTGDEARSGAAVTIVSAATARKLWPSEEPLGKRVSLDARQQIHDSDEPYPAGQSLQVIGVAQDIRSASLSEIDPGYFYMPMPSNHYYETLLVRAENDPNTLTAALGNQVNAVDPNAIVYAETLDGLMTNNPPFVISRIGAVLSTIIGLLGLGLASVGISGMVSFAVIRRTQEIGVRMALGAGTGDVMNLVLRQSMKPVAAGLVAGIILSAAVSRLLKFALFGLSSLDPVAFLGVSVFIAMVALAASYVPARRAARVDPMVALRHE
jgi:putative ABC transport system permease protein